MAAISALRLASELIRREKTKGKSLTNLSLQKLAYFCHGWHLAIFDAPLVDEAFEAWRFGPVLPSVYHKLKVFSSNWIPSDYPLVLSEAPLDTTSEASKLIDRVLEVYGNYSGFDLVNLSHHSDGPWSSVWQGGGLSSSVIDDESIKQYFKSLAKQ